jgi:hypothetical protein
VCLVVTLSSDDAYRFLVSDVLRVQYCGSVALQRWQGRYYVVAICIKRLRSDSRAIQLGLRWRVEKEVLTGKGGVSVTRRCHMRSIHVGSAGHFVCGGVDCAAIRDLHTFEVPFAYHEAGQQRQALVKLRLCPGCAFRLHYKKIKQWERELRRKRSVRVTVCCPSVLRLTASCAEERGRVR